LAGAAGTVLRPTLSASIRVLLAAASFVIYASAVLALRQDRDHPFIAEREALAAAVSTAVYHAPLGTTYSGVSASVRDVNTPLRTALKQAAKGDLPPGSLIQNGGMDGNGIGYLVLATAAMLVFGVHTYSPMLMMLGLMGISGAAMLLRFGAGSAVLVVNYFFPLTLLLYGWLVWDPSTALNIPIGGIRYLAILGIMPAFHLACELLDRAPDTPGTRRWRFGLLAVQVVILLLGALTRTSGASLLAATGLVWLITLWRHRRDRSRTRRQLANGVFIGSVACAFLTIILLLLPANYLADGRITGQVWHRIFVGLGLNPEWPFGNLREVYDCDYPEAPGLRLEPGLLDANGACVWVHYAHAHNIQPFPVAPAPLEAAERNAFFNVARLYPRQVLDTFIYYKPLMMFAEIKNVTSRFLILYGRLRGSPFFRFLFWAALGNLSLFLIIPSAAPNPTWSLGLGGIALLFAVFNVPGYLLAWPGTSQTLDLKVYAFLIAGIALNAVAESIRLLWVTAMGFGWNLKIPVTWRSHRSVVRDESS
jgi:Flp pilus assembly protein TadB